MGTNQKYIIVGKPDQNEDFIHDLMELCKKHHLSYAHAPWIDQKKLQLQSPKAFSYEHNRQVSKAFPAMYLLWETSGVVCTNGEQPECFEHFFGEELDYTELNGRYIATYTFDSTSYSNLYMVMNFLEKHDFEFSVYFSQAAEMWYLYTNFDFEFNASSTVLNWVIEAHCEQGTEIEALEAHLHAKVVEIAETVKASSIGCMLAEILKGNQTNKEFKILDRKIQKKYNTSIAFIFQRISSDYI